jgi:hypothetical protein
MTPSGHLACISLVLVKLGKCDGAKGAFDMQDLRPTSPTPMSLSFFKKKANTTREHLNLFLSERNSNMKLGSKS